MPRLSGTALLNAKVSGTSTKSGGGRKAGAFTPLFGLPVGETTYIKFLTDDLEEVFLHTWVRVPPRFPDRNTRGYDWEVFTSRTRNEGFGDEVSVIETELDHWPLKKLAAIAVILEPVFTAGKPETFSNLTDLKVVGNTTKRADGSDIFYPRWNLVFEAYGSFWENLVMIANSVGLSSFPLQVSRVASDSYAFMPIQHISPTVDWDNYTSLVPTIVEEIARLGSEERYEEYFGPGKLRIERQDQKHHYLPEWMQEERKQYLLENGIDLEDVEPEEEVVEPRPRATKSNQNRKSKISFDDIETGADEDGDVEPY